MGADNSDASIVKGLLYGGGVDQLIGQAIGSAAVTVATFVVAMGLMYAVKATGTLRVSKEGELEGLDIHEHGGPAYPELIGGGGSGGYSGKESSSEPMGALATSK